MSSAARRVAVALACAFAVAGAWAPSRAVETAGESSVDRVAISASPAAEIDRLAKARRDPLWVGYEAPLVAGERSVCCSADRHGRRTVCDLEQRSWHVDHSSSLPRNRTASGTLVVLFRIADGSVQRIRSFTADCPLEAGGREIRLLEGVEPTEGIRLLEKWVAGASGEDLAESAVAATALHADPEADRVLGRIFKGDSRPEIRGTAAFWLGLLRGGPGFELLVERLAEETDLEVREQIVFGLSQSEEPQAARVLIRVARRDRDAGTRSHALFWLSQTAGRVAAEAIHDAAIDDPEIEVKKQAVFALSQLPASEGGPLMIEIAKNHRQPEVREAAMFWLSQSGDGRAIDLFEEILSR